MTRFYITTIFILLSATLIAIPDTAYHNTYGGLSQDHGRSIDQTYDMGFIITGSTSSKGFGSSDVYLIKIDSVGNFRWSKTFVSPFIEWGNSLQETADSGFVIVGYTNKPGAGGYDILMIRTDSIGDTLWTRTYGGTDWDIGYSVQQTTDGGFIIVGETYSYGAGNSDIYLIRTNSNGDTLWTKTYGGSLGETGRCVKQTVEGGFIIAGATESYGAGEKDVYLVKTDENGDTLWTQVYGGDSIDIAHCIMQDSDSNYVIAGATQSYGAGNLDFLLFKTDTLGDTLWMDTLGGPDDEEWFWVDEDYNGKYIVTGYSFTQIGAGKEDVFFYRVTKNDVFEQFTTYGGTLYERGHCITDQAQGGYIIVGSTNSFGVGMNDVYVIRTDSSGLLSGSPTVTVFYDSIATGTTVHKRPEGTVTVYPNPFAGTATVELGELTKHYAEIRFSLYNLTGQLVQNKENVSQTFLIHQNHLSEGIYFYQLDGLDRSTGSRQHLVSGKLVISSGN